jgi:crotonobetainyl-CoA:carnitine CoA-transferase CaiB-like acyl-CoA transferase
MPQDRISTPETSQGGGSGPLAGLLVADFSRVLAGPYCTMLLADLGATVIKVESPAGDDTRNWKPPVRGEDATYFLSVNRNKRSVAFDLREPGDLRLAQELAARADVLVENFRPGTLERFGLDQASASARNPRLVYASISGFGPDKGAELPGYDLIAQAVSGLMSVTGEPDGPPYKAGVAVVDVMAGLHATVGILAALNHVRATGQGQHVQVNLLSSALSGLVNQTSGYVAGGVIPHRMGNAHPSLAPYEPLPTADGELVIAVCNDGQFRRLCAVLGLPDLADDPRFATNPGRTAHRESLRSLLVARLSKRPRQEWLRELTAVGVPCGLVNTVAEGVALADELGLEPVVTVGDGSRGVPTVRNPITLSATPAGYHLPPPALDEQGTEIRAWLATRVIRQTP